MSGGNKPLIWDYQLHTKEILFGLLIAVATNLVFILSMVIRKCLKGLRKCVNFILSRTANREDVEFQGEEIEK